MTLRRALAAWEEVVNVADTRTHEQVRDSESNFARRLTVALEQRDLAWDALRQIVKVPSERTLLLNAEARAMYELARRVLEES